MILGQPGIGITDSLPQSVRFLLLPHSRGRSRCWGILEHDCPCNLLGPLILNLPKLYPFLFLLHTHKRKVLLHTLLILVLVRCQPRRPTITSPIENSGQYRGVGGRAGSFGGKDCIVHRSGLRPFLRDFDMSWSKGHPLGIRCVGGRIFLNGGSFLEGIDDRPRLG